MVFGYEMAKAKEVYKPAWKKDRKFNVNFKDPGGGVTFEGGTGQGKGKKD